MLFQDDTESYVIRGSCPNCGTLVTLETCALEMVMFACEGCGHGIAYHNNRIYVVRYEFLENLNKKYPTKEAGTVLYFDYSTRYNSAKGVPKAEEIETVLGQEDVDCLELIQKIDDL
jgi:hypothetical protein